jgi:hypothetical protein
VQEKVSQLEAENRELKEELSSLKDNYSDQKELRKLQEMWREAVDSGPKVKLSDGIWMDIIELEKKYRATEYARKTLEEKRKEDKRSIQNWTRTMNDLEQERDFLKMRVYDLELQLDVHPGGKENCTNTKKLEPSPRQPLKDITVDYMNTQARQPIRSAAGSSQATTAAETSSPLQHGTPPLSHAIRHETQGMVYSSSPPECAAESIDLRALGMQLSSPPRQQIRMSPVDEVPVELVSSQQCDEEPGDVDTTAGYDGIIYEDQTTNSSGSMVKREKLETPCPPQAEKKRRRGDFINEIDEDLRSGRREVMFNHPFVTTPINAAVPVTVTPLDMWLDRKKLRTQNKSATVQLPTPTSIGASSSRPNVPNQTPTRGGPESPTEASTLVKRERITIADLRARQWHPRDFIINPSSNDGRGHAFKEIVRGRSRQCEHGASCKECQTVRNSCLHLFVRGGYLIPVLQRCRCAEYIGIFECCVKWIPSPEPLAASPFAARLLEI